MKSNNKFSQDPSHKKCDPSDQWKFLSNFYWICSCISLFAELEYIYLFIDFNNKCVLPFHIRLIFTMLTKLNILCPIIQMSRSLLILQNCRLRIIVVLLLPYGNLRCHTKNAIFQVILNCFCPFH